jgi:ribose transport system ATP-binding protein
LLLSEDDAVANLELNQVSKRYGGVVALDEATLHCITGEVHGLVGENGAGKSTLVKILSGAVEPDAGTILFNDERLAFSSPGEAIRSGIGMVYQELSLIPDLTVGQNIFFGIEQPDSLGGTSRRVLRERCYQLFDQMGIEVADPDRTINELSLAQRQMVEIAKVIARDPAVIVLDEATSALGRAQAEWLLDFCGRLAAQGKIFVYISHKLSEIREVAHRITVFRNGKDVGTRDRDEATTDELVGLMLGRRIGRLYAQRATEINSEPLLKVNRLRSGVRLKDVSLTLQKGEILGIGGLTGQGQEELFRALYGVQPSDGQIELEGKSVHIKSPSEALENNIALVPEDRATQGLLFPKPVSENISLSVLPKLLRFGLLDRSSERTMVRKAIDQFSIVVPDPADPVQRLSGGNQQKVVLAKLLATQPRVLMMFDSTRGVDVGTKAEIYSLLRELAEAGSSILWYSTDNDELINMCDRVLVLRQGQVEAELSEDLITEENIIRASVGESISHNTNDADRKNGSSENADTG